MEEQVKWRNAEEVVEAGEEDEDQHSSENGD